MRVTLPDLLRTPTMAALNPGLASGAMPEGQRLPQDAPGGPGRVKTGVTREARLQAACEQWLTHHGIVFLHLSCRAREKKGWPDLTFAVGGLACGVELKSATGALTEEQRSILEELTACGWRVAVCRTLDEFCEFVKRVKGEVQGKR